MKFSTRLLLTCYTCYTIQICDAVLTPARSPVLVQTQQPELNKALHKKIKDQTFDEAVWAKNYSKETKDYETAIKCAERILAVGGDPEIMRSTLLELTQLCLNEKNLEKAQKYALEYQTLYPATAECKQARYYGIKAHFLATLSPDRDQSSTQKTIELAQEFIKQYPQDTEYITSVKDMLNTCYTTLLESELQIITNYISRYNYTKKQNLLAAAQKRVSYIKDKLYAHVPSIEQARVATIEQQLAQLVPQLTPTQTAKPLQKQQ